MTKAVTVLSFEQLRELVLELVERVLERGGREEPMTRDQVAELLGVQPDTVSKYARRDGLPSFRIGKSRLFLRSQVDAWVLERAEGRRGRAAGGSQSDGAGDEQE